MKRQLILSILLFSLLSSARPCDSTGISPKVTHTAWYSHSEHIFRRVDIYVPEGYEHTSLPALYLIHGINGYEGSWQDMGGAIDTLNAMIAAGRCRPLILVMPDCNKWPLKQRPVNHGNLWKCLTHYGKLSREHQLEHALSDLITMIDSTCCVTPYCAVAGLSDGGRMAANVANLRSDCVRSVGLFSPVLHKNQLPTAITDSRLSTFDFRLSTNYYIYVGEIDIFYASGHRFHRRMKRAGYPHRFTKIHAGHNWHMWRLCLSDFLAQQY